MATRQDSTPVMERAISSESPNVYDYGESPRRFAHPHSAQAGGPYSQFDALHENENGPSLGTTASTTVPDRKPQASRWCQCWYVLRWKLATNVFSRPIPWLTANYDVKVGDVIILLPLVGGLIALSASTLVGLHTKDSGGPASIAMTLTYALSVRNNSLLLALTGLSFERVIFYHKVFAYVTLVTSTIHTISYFLKHNEVYGSSSSDNLNAGKVFTEADLDDANADYFVTGVFAYGPLLLLLASALYVVRRKFFELFWRLHWVLFLGIYAGCVLHYGGGTVNGGFGLWAIDALYRFVYKTRVYKYGALIAPKSKATNDGVTAAALLASQQPRGVAAPSQVHISKLSSDVVCIQFPKIRADTGERFHYEAGQFAFLCVPALSWLEWHPFTISSAPHEPFVTFHVRALGNWTQKLVALAANANANADDSKTSPSPPLPLELLVDGPYGNVSVDIASPAAYSHFALISGGIGVTPMKAIVNQLHFEFQHLDRVELQKVHFVWSVRDREMLQAMAGLEIFETTYGLDQAKQLPASYFPQELMSGRTDGGPGAVFSTEIFLTQSERDLEHPLDFALESSMRYRCRPDVAEILRMVGKDALQHGKRRVAVLACGPAAMIKDVIETSIKLTREMKVRFDVHTENFEF